VMAPIDIDDRAEAKAILPETAFSMVQFSVAFGPSTQALERRARCDVAPRQEPCR
jgi:hypothetical protein